MTRTRNTSPPCSLYRHTKVAATDLGDDSVAQTQEPVALFGSINGASASLPHEHLAGSCTVSGTDDPFLLHHVDDTSRAVVANLELTLIIESLPCRLHR